MAGIILFAALGAWFMLALGVAVLVAKKTIKERWGIPLSVFIFLIILVAPIVDDIVGSWQFNALCNEHSDIYIDYEAAKGKEVYLADNSFIKVNSSWVGMSLDPWRYLDAETDEVIFSFYLITRGGGYFSRFFTSGGFPVFSRSSCRPDEIVSVFEFIESIGATQIQREELIQRNDK